MASVKSSEGRTYGGRTGAERETDRRAALVQAAFLLVAEDGWRQLNVEALCRRAGLNKRYFYEAFDSLDAIIAAVTTTLADDAIATTLAAFGPAEHDDAAVHRAITAFVEYLTAEPHRARVLFGAVPAGDAAAGHRAAAVRRLIASVATQGQAMHELGDDPAVQTAAAMLVGGTSQAVLDWLDEEVPCSREVFIDDLVELWLAIGDVAAGRALRRQ